MSDTVTRWWWVRHAPVIGHDGKIYGQTDVPCDTSDTASFKALAGMLPDDALWVSSHLSRTIETAAAIRAAGKEAPEPMLEPMPEPDFAEQHFGDWQKHSWDELHEAGCPEYKAFWDNPGYGAAPGGESFADQIARVAAAMDRFNENHGGRDIVAVTHGGTIRAAIATALAVEPVKALAIKIDNLSLTRIDHVAGGLFKGQGGMWRINSVNLAPLC